MNTASGVTLSRGTMALRQCALIRDMAKAVGIRLGNSWLPLLWQLEVPHSGFCQRTRHMMKAHR